MPTLTIHDLKNLRSVLRYISTSDATVQNETLRLDALLARVIAAHENSSRNTKETR